MPEEPTILFRVRRVVPTSAFQRHLGSHARLSDFECHHHHGGHQRDGQAVHVHERPAAQTNRRVPTSVPNSFSLALWRSNSGMRDPFQDIHIFPQKSEWKPPRSLSPLPLIPSAMGRRAAESVAPSRPSTPPAEQDLDEVCAILTRVGS